MLGVFNKHSFHCVQFILKNLVDYTRFIICHIFK